MTEKRALEGARRPSARTTACMRRPTARIARKDVNFEAPFGGLGSFSCKRSFLIEECLLRATISVVSKDVDQPARLEDIVNLPLLYRLCVFSIERQWRFDRPAFGRSSSFGFGRFGSLLKRFVNIGGKLLVSRKKYSG